MGANGIVLNTLYQGAKTLSIATFSITTLNIIGEKTLSIATFSITTHSIIVDTE